MAKPNDINYCCSEIISSGRLSVSKQFAVVNNLTALAKTPEETEKIILRMGSILDTAQQFNLKGSTHNHMLLEIDRLSCDSSLSRPPVAKHTLNLLTSLLASRSLDAQASIIAVKTFKKLCTRFATVQEYGKECIDSVLRIEGTDAEQQFFQTLRDSLDAPDQKPDTDPTP